MISPLLVYITTATPEEARSLAETLVQERLAACCTVIEGARSIYRWESEVKQEQETLMMIKTMSNVYSDLEKRVRELHSYDTPEIIAVDIKAGSRDYLVWLQGEVT